MILDTFISKQFLRFIIAGAIAACVNFTVGFSLAGLFPHHLDIVFGHLSGMVVAFFLFERRVFGQGKDSRLREAAVFSLVNGLAVLQTWLVYVLLHNHILPELARMIAIVIPVFTSYLGHKYFTFRH